MDLFHLVASAAWAQAQRDGALLPPSLATEGFVHLSTAAQWPRTRRRFFAGTPGLVLLTVDASRLVDPVRFEPADGEAFPHLYGPLPTSAVTAVRDLDAELDAHLLTELRAWLAGLAPSEPIGVFDVQVNDVDDGFTLHLAFDETTNSLSEAFDHGSTLGEYDRAVPLRTVLEALGLVPVAPTPVSDEEARRVMNAVVGRFQALVRGTPGLFAGLPLRSPWHFQRSFTSGCDPDPFYEGV